jgi:Retrotransposon gag protein/Zinc knuckle
VDEVRTAERQLHLLKQTGSATKYAAEFQQLASRVEWGDSALEAKFYDGLKEFVKDEIARTDRPTGLQKLIALGVKIDNRLYERRMEKTVKGKTYFGGGRQDRSKRDPYWDPMDLDAMRRKDTRPRGPRKTGRNKSRKDVEKRKEQFEKKLCFRCGKPGHQAKACRGSQQLSAVEGSPKNEEWDKSENPYWDQPMKPNKLQPVPHALLSWTACYDNECRIHQSEKEGSGWYPKKRKEPKNISVMESGPFNKWWEGETSYRKTPKRVDNEMKNWKWNEDHYSWTEGSEEEDPVPRAKRDPDTEEWVNVTDSEEETEIPFIDDVTDNWITVTTDHWKITDCTDGECEEPAQHKHRVYEPEAPKQQTAKVKLKVCQKRGCPDETQAHLHSHQGSGERNPTHRVEIDTHQIRQEQPLPTKDGETMTIMGKGFQADKPYGRFPCEEPSCGYNQMKKRHMHFRNCQENETKNDSCSPDRDEGEH